MDLANNNDIDNKFFLTSENDNCIENDNPMDQANIFELEQAEGSNDIQALLGSIGSIHSSENIDYQNFMGMNDIKASSSNDGGDLQSLISEIKHEQGAQGEYFDLNDI